MNKVPSQLTLSVRLRDDITFNNFFAGSNMLAIQSLRSSLYPTIFLWGGKGVGCSHLLQALCADLQPSTLYLPLDEVISHGTDVFHELENLKVVCLDNVEVIAGNIEWEEAFFHLFNRLRDSGTRLIMAAHAAPRELAIGLADLQSRLSSAVVFHIQALNDEEKAKVLTLRAHLRGLELTDEVSSFIVKRSARDMSSLLMLLEKLDQQSFSEKRKLTINFVKEVLGL
jgi:DnaA family protein